MNHIHLLQTALEFILDGSTEDAATIFISLGEELEAGADMDPEELREILQILLDGYAE